MQTLNSGGYRLGRGSLKRRTRHLSGSSLRNLDCGGAGGPALLSFRSVLKSGRFDHVWNSIMGECDNRKPVNDNGTEMAIDTMVA